MKIHIWRLYRRREERECGYESCTRDNNKERSSAAVSGKFACRRRPTRGNQGWLAGEFTPGSLDWLHESVNHNRCSTAQCLRTVKTCSELASWWFHPFGLNFSRPNGYGLPGTITELRFSLICPNRWTHVRSDARVVVSRKIQTALYLATFYFFCISLNRFFFFHRPDLFPFLWF